MNFTRSWNSFSKKPYPIDTCSIPSKSFGQNLHHDLWGRCVVICFWSSLAICCRGSRSAPGLESHLSVLHTLVVCPPVQLVFSLVVRHIQNTVTFSFLTPIHVLTVSAVFHVHYSCRQKVGLFQSNVTRLLGSLPSVTRLIASSAHDGRCKAGWHPHEQIMYVHVPFLSGHRFPSSRS